MELWVSKLTCLILIFGLSLFFGLIPLKFVAYLRRREYDANRLSGESGGISAQKVLSYLNCFAGGVFLGTCLLHLFPEVAERFEDIRTHLAFDFPIADLTIAAGFFLIMIIEHVAMSLHERHKKRQVSERTPILPPGSVHTSYDRQSSNYDVPGRAGVIEDRVAEGPGHEFMSSFSSSYQCYDEEPHHHHPGQTHEETVQIHAIRSLLLLIALSIHTVFEGLALGLETTVSQIWTLFAALAVHKSIIAFTLGLQFADTFRQKTRMVMYIVIFSLVCPIGVGVGIGISAFKTTALWYTVTSMCLQGLATGTFLYVTFFEVLQKELGVEEHSISKVLIIVLGFVVIALTALLEAVHG